MSARAEYRRGPVFAACCLGMLLFGVVLTALGAILPSLMDRFGLDKALAGTLFTLLSFGILAGSLVFGPIVDRYGYRVPLILSSALILAGLEAIAFATSLAALRAGALLIGLGGGVVNGGTNALVADISEGERSAGLSLLGVFFGLGAFGVPFAHSLLLDRLSYTAILAGIGAFVAVPLLLFAAIRFPEPKQAQGFPLRDAVALLRERALLLLGLILFFESGMEISVGGWSAAYFGEELALEAGDAVFVLSLYWFGMTAARVVLTGILRRVSPALVLVASLGIALAGALTMLLSHGAVPAAAGLLLVGAGFAAVFPVILGYVGDLYPTLSGTAFSMVLVMALAGGMTLPYVIGVFGGAYGLRASLAVVPAAICAAVLVFRFAWRVMPAARAVSP